MRITTKGQVTIPIEVRERLGLLPDTEVQFRVRGNVAILEKVSGKRTHRGSDVVERLRGKGTVKLTTDQILALTRG